MNRGLVCACIARTKKIPTLILCPRRVNGSNKKTPCMRHPRRWNVTTSMVGLENGHISTNFTQNGEPQRYSWERWRRRRRRRSAVIIITCQQLTWRVWLPVAGRLNKQRKRINHQRFFFFFLFRGWSVVFCFWFSFVLFVCLFAYFYLFVCLFLLAVSFFKICLIHHFRVKPFLKLFKIMLVAWKFVRQNQR